MQAIESLVKNALSVPAAKPGGTAPTVLEALRAARAKIWIPVGLPRTLKIALNYTEPAHNHTHKTAMLSWGAEGLLVLRGTKCAFCCQRALGPTAPCPHQHTIAGGGGVVGVAGHEVRLAAKAPWVVLHLAHTHIIATALQVVLGDANELALLVGGICHGRPAHTEVDGAPPEHSIEHAFFQALCGDSLTEHSAAARGNLFFECQQVSQSSSLVRTGHAGCIALLGFTLRSVFQLLSSCSAAVAEISGNGRTQQLTMQIWSSALAAWGGRWGSHRSRKRSASGATAAAVAGV
eukprot:1143878-Pelagomonas_calceolata.AAC.3